jgi:hypothetical protein
MVEATRPKRKYDSRRRQAQAAKTRRAILEAAQVLFERDGHVATTMEAIAAHDGLRPGVDVGRATDILWTLNHPHVWALLVDERGWTPDDFESWFAAVTSEQILGAT